MGYTPAEDLGVLPDPDSSNSVPSESDDARGEKPNGAASPGTPSDASDWSPTDETLRPDAASPPNSAQSTRRSENSSPPHSAVQQIGPYRIERLLGRGGMGVVYEATHLEHGTRVALKMIRDLDGSLHRFLGEFHALAQLRHEHLVRIDELALDGPEPYYTMELVDGTSFLDWVRGGSAAGPDGCDELRLREGLAQLVSALVYMHRAGQLHRDLKPSNVLVTHAGRVKIVDFGLAAKMDRRGRYENSVPGAPIGTLAYMSPEQAQGRDLQAAADWYSVGVMIYECLTGQSPFHARTVEQLIAEKRQPVPRPAAGTAAPDLLELALQLMRAEPARRPDQAEIIVRLGAEQNLAQESEHTMAGRSELLRQLLGIFDAVEQRGESRLVFVHGASGMGKSELLRALLDELREQRRAEVFAGRCYESVLVPYKAFDALNVALARWLLRLPAAHCRAVMPLDVDALCEMLPVFAEVFTEARGSARRVDPQDRRRQAFQAYRELLARISRAGPVPGQATCVFFIDDLQWGDVDSAALLVELWRQPPPATLMICAFRTEDVATSPCLRAVQEMVREVFDSNREGVGCESLEVGPLSETAALELARELLGESGDERLVELAARESAGNPFFLGELVRYLQRHATAMSAADQASLVARMSLDEVLADLVATVAEDERQVLEIVAVAGRPLDRTLACLSAGFERQRPAVVHRLIDERLLRSVGGEYYGPVDTYHDRIREMLLRRTAPDRVRQCHAAIAHTLVAEQYPDPEFLGQQFHAAGEVVKAGEYLQHAGLLAEKALAFDRAARLYRLAFDAEPTGAARRELCLRLAQALAHAGRGREAAAQFLDAAELSTGEAAWQARCEAALRYLTSGHIQNGLWTLEQVLREVDLRLPRSQLGSLVSVLYWRTRLWLRGPRQAGRATAQLPARETRQLDGCWAAVAGLSLVDPLRAAGYVARNLVLARQAGEPRRLIRALAVHTSHVAIGGSRSRQAAARHLRRLREIVANTPGPYARAMLALSEGTVAHLCGEWRAAWSACEQAEQWFRESEHPDVAWELDTAQTFSLWARMYAGDYQVLAERQPVLRRGAIERDDLFGRANFGARVLATVRLGLGRPQEAREAVEADLQLLPTGMFHVQHHNLVLARAMLQMTCGEGRQAYQGLAQAWSHYRRALLSHVQQVRIDFFELLGRAALAAAAQDPQHWPDCAAAVRRSVRRLERERAAWGSAMAALLRAGAASFEATPAETAARYEEAAAKLQAVHMTAFAKSAAARRQLWLWRAGSLSSRECAAAMSELRSALGEPRVWLPLLTPCREQELPPVES